MARTWRGESIKEQHPSPKMLAFLMALACLISQQWQFVLRTIHDQFMEKPENRPLGGFCPLKDPLYQFTALLTFLVLWEHKEVGALGA